MSGHSKWSTIKRKKAANDAARAREFTKVARMITVAAQNGGGDPDLNPALALAIEKARAINMPNDNIQKAILRATGGSDGSGRIEEVTYEVYGPNNTAILIDCMTDNKNRTTSEVRSLVEKNGGRFAENGSVSWQFKTFGLILMEFENPEERDQRNKQKWSDSHGQRKITTQEAEEFQLSLFDVKGVIDVVQDEIGLQIKTEFAELNSVRKFIQSLDYRIEEAGIIKESIMPIDLSDNDKNRLEEFINKIQEIDEVQDVWTNVK